MNTLAQLRKLSIYKPMQYRITEIDIDFTDSLDDITKEEQSEVIDEVLATTWEACGADDLIEEITSATGWCINSIDYCYVLN